VRAVLADIAETNRTDMPLDIWPRLTNLGDSSFLLPAALLVALFVSRGVEGARRAKHWLLIFGACGLSVLLSKVAYEAWGVSIRSINFRGFSGHTALAAALFPVAGFFVCDGSDRAVRLGGAAVGMALAVLVGISRVVVGAHSASEASGGLVLGLLASGWYLQARWLTIPARPEDSRGTRLMLGMGVVFAYSWLAGRAPTHEWAVILAEGLRSLSH
jgi:membrane-associated phospholipid phosphatase